MSAMDGEPRRQRWTPGRKLRLPRGPSREARPAAERFAGWAPADPGPCPVFPRGTALFEGIPAPAIVIEALAPVIGDGALVSRGIR